jgi:hypothetical protein
LWLALTFAVERYEMNEKIKGLADQAWVYQMTVHEYDGVRTYGEREQVFSKEKFAELIIQEMCQVMKAEGEQFSLDQNFDALKGVGRCMRKVKEHFGVDR